MRRRYSSAKFSKKPAKKQKTYEWDSETFASLDFNPKLKTSLYSFGSNLAGQLGLGDDVDETLKPKKISFDEFNSPIVQIKCGGMHTVTLLGDSSVVTFGCNDDGALGRYTEDLDEEGVPKKVESDIKVVQITAGDNFTAILGQCGRVYICGSFRNKDGNFGLLHGGEIKETTFKHIPMDVPVKQISAGYNHLGMLTIEGEIYTIGSPEFGQLGRIPVYFSARFHDSWKDKYLTSLPLRDRDISSISNIWCGGRNTFFQLDKNKYPGGSILFGCGINNFGQLGVYTEDDQYLPIELPFFEDKKIKQISVGDHHTLFLLDSGDLYACGRNTYGQLGVAELNDLEDDISWDPVLIQCGTKFKQCSCGVSSSFGLGVDDVIYKWGSCSTMIGSSKDKVFQLNEPTPIGSFTDSSLDITDISTGGLHSCVMCSKDEEKIYSKKEQNDNKDEQIDNNEEQIGSKEEQIDNNEEQIDSEEEQMDNNEEQMDNNED